MIVTTCEVDVVISFTGFPPIHVSMITITVNIQNMFFLYGLNFLFIDFFLITINDKIMIDRAIAKTPPSFDGIDRKIA